MSQNSSHEKGKTMKRKYCKCEHCEPHSNNPYIKKHSNDECDKDKNSGCNGSKGYGGANFSGAGWNSNGYGYGANGYGSTTSFFSTGNTQRDFIVGALIGAAASFILTNENAQKALLKGFAKLSSLFEMGVEELKERYEDAKAEVNS